MLTKGTKKDEYKITVEPGDVEVVLIKVPFGLELRQAEKLKEIEAEHGAFARFMMQPYFQVRPTQMKRKVIYSEEYVEETCLKNKKPESRKGQEDLAIWLSVHQHRFGVFMLFANETADQTYREVADFDLTNLQILDPHGVPATDQSQVIVEIGPGQRQVIQLAALSKEFSYEFVYTNSVSKQS